MPLTARHVDGRHIDSTSDEQWAEVHVSSYQGLFCPECRHGMYARKPPNMIRHFAHKAGRPNSCSLTAAESPQHLHTKALVAEAVRTLGWTAEVERPGDGWRADVLATSPSGQERIAFEPQFATIHESVARERTQRHQASGVKTVWLDAKGQESLAEFSRGRLFYDERDPRVGVQAFSGRSWGPHRLPLSAFVQRLCLGRLTHDGRYWADEQDRQTAVRRAQEEAKQRAEEERLAEARREWNRKHAEEQEVRRRQEQGRIDREIAEHREQRERERQREQKEQERVRQEREQERRERWEREAVERQERERKERERQEREAVERQEREQKERERQKRETAERWERERPERERREREAAEHERRRQERAAEWPLERIRALMTATREELGRAR